MRVELLTMALFGIFGGYFFGNFRDKALQYYMTICYPLLASN